MMEVKWLIVTKRLMGDYHDWDASEVTMTLMGSTDRNISYKFTKTTRQACENSCDSVLMK